MKRLAPIAVLAFAAAGCGGSGQHYSLASTQSCLINNGLNAQPDSGASLAPKGSEGGLDVTSGSNSADIYVEFGKDSHEADQITKEVIAAASAFGQSASDTSKAMARKGNVAYWTNDTHWPPAKATVEECLSSGARAAAPPATSASGTTRTATTTPTTTAAPAPRLTTVQVPPADARAVVQSLRSMASDYTGQVGEAVQYKGSDYFLVRVHSAAGDAIGVVSAPSVSGPFKALDLGSAQVGCQTVPQTVLATFKLGPC
jgi:hypothetical protein